MVASGGRTSSTDCGLPVGGDVVVVDPAGVADVRSAIKTEIAVEDFTPGAGVRHADPVTVPRHRRHVADHKDRRLIGGIAQEAKTPNWQRSSPTVH